MDALPDIVTTESIMYTDSKANKFNTETILLFVSAALGITCFVTALIMVVIYEIVMHCIN